MYCERLYVIFIIFSPDTEDDLITVSKRLSHIIDFLNNI